MPSARAIAAQSVLDEAASQLTLLAEVWASLDPSGQLTLEAETAPRPAEGA